MAVTGWQHKGVAITFNEQGANFVARVNGNDLKAPSLDAMKKKIDGAQLIEFKPFKAVKGSMDDLAQFDVVGIRKSAGFSQRISRGETVFVCVAKNGNEFETDSVTPATKENIDTIKFANQEWEACRKIEQDAESRRTKARDAIPDVRARDYGTLKVKP